MEESASLPACHAERGPHLLQQDNIPQIPSFVKASALKQLALTIRSGFHKIMGLKGGQRRFRGEIQSFDLKIKILLVEKGEAGFEPDLAGLFYVVRGDVD